MHIKRTSKTIRSIQPRKSINAGRNMGAVWQLMLESYNSVNHPTQPFKAPTPYTPSPMPLASHHLSSLIPKTAAGSIIPAAQKCVLAVIDPFAHNCRISALLTGPSCPSSRLLVCPLACTW